MTLNEPQRYVLKAVLIWHQRRESGGCQCGASLPVGLSHADHVAERFDKAAEAAAYSGEEPF